MSFSTRQQKLDKCCRGYKVGLLRPRLTKHCWGRVPGVPGGVDFTVTVIMGEVRFLGLGGLTPSPSPLALEVSPRPSHSLVHLSCT